MCAHGTCASILSVLEISDITNDCVSKLRGLWQAGGGKRKGKREAGRRMKQDFQYIFQ